MYERKAVCLHFSMCVFTEQFFLIRILISNRRHWNLFPSSILIETGVHLRLRQIFTSEWSVIETDFILVLRNSMNSIEFFVLGLISQFYPTWSVVQTAFYCCAAGQIWIGSVDSRTKWPPGRNLIKQAMLFKKCVLNWFISSLHFSVEFHNIFPWLSRNFAISFCDWLTNLIVLSSYKLMKFPIFIPSPLV